MRKNFNFLLTALLTLVAINVQVIHRTQVNL